MPRSTIDAVRRRRPEEAAAPQASRVRHTRPDAAKRILDTLVVLMTLPMWLPILAIGLAVSAAELRRWPLFRQKRMGRNARAFEIYKVRTMRDGTAPPRGALFAGWTYARDPRVTRLGAIQRRYRIDELPQLFNVLRGDMSLVGPRPEPFEIAVRLGEALPGYHERHRVRPGLTGLCQISAAYRDFGTLEKSAHKLSYDVQYVRTRSLWLDARILLRTIGVLLRGEGMA